MNINFKKISLLVAAFTGAAMLTWAVGTHFKYSKPAKVTLLAVHKVKPPVYDTVLLNKFNSELRSINHEHGLSTYSGSITIKDGADSSGNIQNMPYIVSVNGQNVYSKIGAMEVIRENGVSIQIDNDQRRVLISKQTQEANNIMDGFAMLQALFKQEGYQLSIKPIGTEKEISMINEKKITCKELSVAYDTATNKLTRLYTRLTDFDAPLDDSKDRVMDVRIDRLENSSNLKEYPRLETIVDQSGGIAKLTGHYTGYKLIIL